jgi:hypothetical protein
MPASPISYTCVQLPLHAVVRSLRRSRAPVFVHKLGISKARAVP